MLLRNQIQPYELALGETQRLVEKWISELSDQFAQGKGFTAKEIDANMDEIARSFTEVKINKIPKVKVGVVGEIYVKYAALGNNDLEAFLAHQGCEVNLPGIMGFMLFKVDNRLEDIKLYGGSKVKYSVVNALMQYFLKLEASLIKAVSKYGFMAPSSYEHTKSLVDGVIGFGSKMGEGWLLTAEMLELTEAGYGNIVCTQPFGCLPNHINGKGMIRRIKAVDSRANIVAIDYDPGAPRVNQENRIKLMLAVARENLENKVKAESESKESAVKEAATA